MSRTAQNHAKAVLDLERKETDMVRAFRAWDKARETVRRYENRLNKGLRERHSQIGGSLSPSDLDSAGTGMIAHAVRRGAARVRR